LIVETEMKSKF